eukprot:jgi/Bigna1/90822/estExt_fgenesh1_pg.C_800063
MGSAISAEGYIHRTGVYCVNVNISIKADRRDDFLEVIRNNQKGTMDKEPLALEYTWGESAEKRNTFFFHEKYKGRSGFVAHQRTKHFKKWKEFVASDPFTKPPQVFIFESAQ